MIESNKIKGGNYGQSPNPTGLKSSQTLDLEAEEGFSVVVRAFCYGY